MTTPSFIEDLSLLRAFTGIVDSGSISAAARTLQIPQPTLSRKLKLLEEQCGTLLIRRDTHRMHLTEAGHLLHQDARMLLEMAESSMQRLRRSQMELRGHLRIFSTIDSGQSTVTRLLSRFLQDHPGVTAELSYSNRPLSMIEEGFDAGIVVGGISDDRVVATPAGKISRYLAATPALLALHGPPTDPSSLTHWPWIALSGNQFGSFRKVELIGPDGRQVSVPISPLLLSEGVTSVHEAVRQGAGLAVLPDWLAGGDLASGRLVRVLPEWSAPDLAVHLIHPGERRLPLRTRTFLDFAASFMKAELHSQD